MFIDEFDSHPYCTSLPERVYAITNLGRTELPVVKSRFNLVEKDILELLEPKLYWTDFSEIRSRLKYIGKWSVSCTLSYLISLGYVRERVVLQ
jgi:hypothetical protein